MKIKFKKPEGITFGQLGFGDMFRTTVNGKAVSTVFMKTEEAYNEDDGPLNAVYASTGEHAWFHEKQIVEKVNGTFVEGYEEDAND